MLKRSVTERNGVARASRHRTQNILKSHFRIVTIADCTQSAVGTKMTAPVRKLGKGMAALRGIYGVFFTAKINCVAERSFSAQMSG